MDYAYEAVGIDYSFGLEIFSANYDLREENND